MLAIRKWSVALGLLASTVAAEWPQDVDVNSFVGTEKGIALQGVLNNIGPDGSLVPGASAGIVVASPSKVNPDYFYTWTRDSALTLKTIIDEFLFGNTALEKYIKDYIKAQAVLQTVINPSGTLLSSGAGLGEPKFMVDGTRFNAPWGRPQRDGPALRAIALITYSNYLIAKGDSEKARTVVWPVISNDLSYTGQYWNATGFDLWEEVEGSSFFTTQNQARALIEGAALAKTLGVTCTGCDQAPQVLCFLKSYWNGDFIKGNINANNGRTGIDANPMLGSLSVFDVNAPCDSPTFQPCHSQALANFKVFVDTFRNATLYPINANVSATSGVALGRYPEDVYYNGNPWYLITQGAAEFLYDAVAQWKVQGKVAVDKTSLAFFQALYPKAEATTTTYTSDSQTFQAFVDAATKYADSFVAVAQKYTPKNGSLSEQFLKTNGSQLSAYDLTWSFASFVTMAERRSGQYPPSWAANVAAPPATCAAGSTKGVYAPAAAAGAPNVTSQCQSNVMFVVNATTKFGQNVYLAGNTSELGSWNPNNAQAMSAANYTATHPIWFVKVAMAPAEAVSYAYVIQQGTSYTWEKVNRTLVVPACEDSTAVLLETNDTWNGPVGRRGKSTGTKRLQASAALTSSAD